ncbi:hypothetical protein AVENLUH5627_02778 [Acinetobacter venetianus]|uniref:Tail fiber protein n=1 Tax=Acinetobacter venetianus TaxID=52133 RepID=A0A150HL68_9GAMM|nr:hypothetical protein [Acinetobacter venetianus]KXZ65488.1 hypothetical protein AVENLUH5627_02778 [Acinetobacter venetianus]
MAIEKLAEFAKDGQKNVDGLTETDGFPVLVKPARQWFNWLFNSITNKINELIDKKIDYTDIVDDLVTNESLKPLSAARGKTLNDLKLNKTENAVGVKSIDNRTLKPSQLSLGIQAYFATLSSDNSTYYCDLLSLNGWDDSSGGLKNALVFSKTGQSLHHYQAEYASQTWTIKKQIAYIDSNITGNSASASKLQTPRRINNVQFDGSTDITIFDSTKFKADGRTGLVNDVAWNAISGVYSKNSEGSTQTVVHFLCEGSAPALQLLTAYKNGGLWYRSARDDAGFEEQFERIITEKGGYIYGNLSISNGLYTSKLWGNDDLAVATENNAAARRLLTGGVLASNAFADSSRIPINGIFSKGNISSNGYITIDAPEAQFRHESTGRYLFINGGGWGVYSDNGMVPLSVVSGGTGNSDGRASSADRLAVPRTISLSGAVSGSAVFDGSGSININASLQQGLAINQSFYDETASRVSGVVYTNNSGKPRFLIVTASGSNNTALTHNVGGVQLINTNESALRTLTYPVPDGYSYMITAATIQKWIEVR